MRAAFFHFQIEETDAAIQCSARVLKIVPDYDQVIFNYYDRLVPSVEEKCRWRRKRVSKWRRSGPLPGEPFGVSLSLFSEVLSGTARSGQGRAVVGRGEANP